MMPRARFWDQFRQLAAQHDAELYPHAPGEEWDSQRHVGERRPGVGDYVYHIRADHSDVCFEVFVRKGDIEGSNGVLDLLESQRSEVEARFVGQLDWDRVSERDIARITHRIEGGGFHDEERWGEIQKNMLREMKRLMAALDPAIDSLKLP